MKKRFRTRPNEKYFGEFVINDDGSIKLKFVKKSIGINQYKRTWRDIDTKNFAKLIKRRKLTN